MSARPPHESAPARTSRRGFFWIPGEVIEFEGQTVQRGPAFVAWKAPAEPTSKLPVVLVCYRVESPTRWIWSRLDKMDDCPPTTRVAPAPPPAPPSPPPPTTGPEVPGLPCGGCGSTSYRRVVNGFIFPDGSRADGWHCGGRECGVKLMVGRIRP